MLGLIPEGRLRVHFWWSRIFGCAYWIFHHEECRKSDKEAHKKQYLLGQYRWKKWSLNLEAPRKLLQLAQTFPPNRIYSLRATTSFYICSSRKFFQANRTWLFARWRWFRKLPRSYLYSLCCCSSKARVHQIGKMQSLKQEPALLETRGPKE